MKVEGRAGEVSLEDYACDIAKAVQKQLLSDWNSQDLRGFNASLPSPETFAQKVTGLLVHVPQTEPNELATLVGPFWSSSRTRTALGLRSRQALDSRRRHGSVLGVKSTDGDMFYPVSQFHRRPDGTVEVRPRLVPFLRTLRTFDAWSVGLMLHTPAPELEGATPLDWVRRGGSDDALIDLARTVAREWSSGSAKSGAA